VARAEGGVEEARPAPPSRPLRSPAGVELNIPADEAGPGFGSTRSMITRIMVGIDRAHPPARSTRAAGIINGQGGIVPAGKRGRNQRGPQPHRPPPTAQMRVEGVEVPTPTTEQRG